MMIPSRTALYRVVTLRTLLSHMHAFTAHISHVIGRDGLQNLPPINDHIARDIGLSAADLELSRHKLPSQNTHHPLG